MPVPARKRPPGISAVYAITNMANGKMYIGSTHDLKFRFGRHRAGLNRGTHHNEHLQRAWLKYGGTVFLFRPLVICEVGELERIEQSIVNFIPANQRYNICTENVFSARGIKRSAQARLNISRAKLGPNNPMWGTRRSEESKRKTGAKSKGNKYALGHKDTPETRANKSKAQKLRYQSPELREQARQFAYRRWRKTEEV